MTDHVRVVTSAPGRNRTLWTPEPSVTDWETFVAWVVAGGTGGKHGRPYSPVTLKESPGRRRNVNLVGRHVLTLDADTAGLDYLDAVDRLPFESLSHTTASHTPEEPRWRTLVPLTRLATPEEAKTLAYHLIHRIGVERFDEQASTSPVAVAYAPAWEGVEFHKRDGQVLDVDDWMTVVDTVPWHTGEVEGAPTVDEFLYQHEVKSLGDLPDCRYGRAALEGIEEEMVSVPEGGGVHATIFRAACRGVEMVKAGCWSTRDLEDLGGVALDMRRERRPEEWPEALVGALKKGCAPDTGCAEHGGDPVFDATPTLRHVRQAAHSRLLSARGLLLCTLARLAVEVPIGTCLPPVVGSRAPLNVGVALVGGSGGGKSALFEVSRELLGLVGTEQRDVERVPGSGEGLIDTYLDKPRDDGHGGKVRPLASDPRRLFQVDEIGQLGAVKDGRSGSTLGPVLRTMLSGGLLGTENATADRRRHVPAGVYRAALVAGVQPAASDVLLNDHDAAVGTPQRFVWTLTADPTIPDEDVSWPGPLEWGVPPWPETVDYPEHVKAEVRRQAREAARGTNREGDRIDGHARLTRLKVAALLAVLHGEAAITDRWWRLAAEVLAWSDEAVAECRAALAASRARQATTAGRLRGHSRLAEEAVVDEDRARRDGVARQLLAKAEEAGEDGLAWSALRNKVRSDRRAVADLLVGTPEDPGPLVQSGQLALAEVEYQGSRGVRVRRGGQP